MNEGVAEQIGTPMDVYARPATLFVAGFIGSPSMSFIEGRMGSDASSVILGSSQRLALNAPLDVTPERAVTVGIRPEHLLTEGEASYDAIDLAVELVEPLGADTLVHGRVDGASLTARLPGDARIGSGERLRLWVPPERLHLFDPASGRRLGPW
jgi:sn-glycerol 3-phosphate transport system ATP-binding protein